MQFYSRSGVCPWWSISICAPLPADVEANRQRPTPWALMGVLSSALLLSVGKIRAWLVLLMGGEIIRSMIATIGE
jgi:hypothetical protein